jgi:hypothetical protein
MSSRRRSAMDPNSARRLPTFLVSVAVGLLAAPAAVLSGADGAEKKATVQINPVPFVSMLAGAAPAARVTRDAGRWAQAVASVESL